MFSTVAMAQTPAAAPAAGPSTLETLFPYIFLFIIFFFLILRPQQKRAQSQKTFLSGLKRGDSVLTTGGIMGTIEGLTDLFVTLQIANGVKIKVLRSAIASGVTEELEKTT
jgi:preprotein translocase subunit YajC